MTDTTTAGRAGIDSQINAMVSGQAVHHAADGHAVPINVQGDSGAISLRNIPGEAPQVTVLRAPNSGNSNRVHDNGTDIRAAAASLAGNLNDLQAKLTETKGFDPQTGKPVLALSAGGRQRADVERQLAQMRATAGLQTVQWAKLQAQRDADAAEDARRLVVAKFVGSDPERAAAVKAEMDRRGAAALVDELLGKAK
ncbi:MAG: hypothetical protein ACREU3_03735 [Steroidobacteraceae bacterium]